MAKNGIFEIQGIRIADGQHLIESQFDRVFNQYSHQSELFDFVSQGTVKCTKMLINDNIR